MNYTYLHVMEIFLISSLTGSHSAVMASSIAGHVICPSAVMYANSASALTDHALTHDACESIILHAYIFALLSLLYV